MYDGREAKVSLKDLAPCPPHSRGSNTLENQLNPINDKNMTELHDRAGTDESSICESETPYIVSDNASENLSETTPVIRRSARVHKGIPPQRYGDPINY